MAFGIGDTIMANSDRPGENANIKKGMKGIIKGKESGFLTDWWEISWEDGKYQDRLKMGETSKITKI